MTRLIDADKLISAVKSNVLTTDSLKTYVEASVNAQPTVDAVPVRHGYWEEYTRIVIPQPYNHYEQAWKCSKCGYDDGFFAWEYCPVCGARMDEDEEGSGEYDCIN